jgi:tRNA pseudouridine55 synthase
MEELIEIEGIDSARSVEDFKEGRILLLDKPLTWSSFDVVNKVRIMLRANLGLKKIKTGHAGTLDPLATGLLILCTGKATKKIDSLMGMDKEYLAEITFGATTPSYDRETEIDESFDSSHITREDLNVALTGFLGKQMQAPPVFSAIKKDGQRAYKHARNGREFELPKREVEFKDVELIDFNPPVAKVRILCSKGTYIRSFADDLGKALHNGAYLSSLKRTAIGPVKLDKAISLDAFEKILQNIRAI